MQLRDGFTLRHLDVGVAIALSEASAPRWRFDYGKAKHDATPDVLVLGDWVHPSTGNRLVGGVNLNYLNQQELNALRKALPQIMRGTDLKSRYRAGKAVLPGIFNTSYRTYNSNHISAVQPSELHSWRPVDYAKDLWGKAKSAVGRVMRPNKQANQPQFQGPMLKPGPVRPAAPGQRPGPAVPGSRAQPAVPGGAPDQDQLAAQVDAGMRELKAMADAQRQRAASLQAAQDREARRKAAQAAQDEFNRQRMQNQQELMSGPQDEEDPLMSDQQMESVRYWSPVKKAYIVERVPVS